MVSNCRQILLAAGLMALLVLAIRLAPDTAPESDHAVIDLSVVNVLHGAQPVGAYSRYGWHHPGPVYFQVLSPLYLLSGYRHLSVTVTATLINLACLIAVAATVRRQANSTALLLTWTLLVIDLLIRMNGLVASPWNPHIV